MFSPCCSYWLAHAQHTRVRLIGKSLNLLSKPFLHPFKAKSSTGKGDFVYYFWGALVSLNYDNPKVRSYAISVWQYWIKTLDIDGYRLDTGLRDQSRFIGSGRVLAQTQFAAESPFLLNGDPVIFQWQETAPPHALYDFPSDDPNLSFRSYNPTAWIFIKT